MDINEMDKSIKKVIPNISNDGNYTWIQIDKDENIYLEYKYNEEQNKTIKRSFLDIKDKQLKYFILYGLNDGRKIIFNLEMDYETVTFFKRHIVNVMTQGEDIIYVVGVKNTLKDTVEYTYILPNGTTYVTSDLNYVYSVYEDNLINKSIKYFYEEIQKHIRGDGE